jgi:hypothetical protein
MFDSVRLNLTGDITWTVAVEIPNCIQNQFCVAGCGLRIANHSPMLRTLRHNKQLDPQRDVVTAVNKRYSYHLEVTTTPRDVNLLIRQQEWAYISGVLFNR